MVLRQMTAREHYQQGRKSGGSAKCGGGQHRDGARACAEKGRESRGTGMGFACRQWNTGSSSKVGEITQGTLSSRVN